MFEKGPRKDFDVKFTHCTNWLNSLAPKAFKIKRVPNRTSTKTIKMLIKDDSTLKCFMV